MSRAQVGVKGGRWDALALSTSNSNRLALFTAHHVRRKGAAREHVEEQCDVHYLLLLLSASSVSLMRNSIHISDRLAPVAPSRRLCQMTMWHDRLPCQRFSLRNRYHVVSNCSSMVLKARRSILVFVSHFVAVPGRWLRKKKVPAERR